MIVHAHGHRSDHLVFVLEGEMTCGEVRCPEGTHLALDHGDTWGPFIAGPEGVTLFEVMMGDPRSFPADPEAYAALLAERDVEQLPNPAISLPGWLDDTRQLMGAPLAPGSVSLRLYPHGDLDAETLVAELTGQAALAAEHRFDGVMTSEHHGGFAGYLPNPLQVAGWCLDTMARGWAAPCPLLLPLRPTALVAEEAAWLAARFPGRVGVGVAAGALPADFEVMGLTMDELAGRFAAALEDLAGMLRGDVDGVLGGDPAIQACAARPVPLVSAAMGFTAVRRAARLGVGILFDSLNTAARCRTLTDAYREAGGPGPCILIRRVWLGEPPRSRLDEQLDRYRSYTPAPRRPTGATRTASSWPVPTPTRSPRDSSPSRARWTPTR